jgi:hypothetical protein
MTITRCTVICFCSLSLLLAACSPTPSTATESIGRTTPVPADWLNLLGLARVYELDQVLSPDGRWLVDIISYEEIRGIRVVSVSDTAPTLDSRPDATLGRYLSLPSWAPDSSAVVVYGADQVAAGCPFERVIICSLDVDTNALNYMVFEPYYPPRDLRCVHTAWSPDSSRLAVTFDQREIIVLDKQAQVLQRITPELNGTSSLFGFLWTEFGLFYRVFDNADPAEPRYELRVVAPEYPEQHRTLLSRQTRLTIVGSDPCAPRLLVREQETGYPPAETFKLLIVNVETGETEQTITVQGRYCDSDDSAQLPFTALQIAEVGEHCGNLWLFDWETGELVNYGEIVALIGWRSDMQGFMVVKGTRPDNLWYETIGP